MPNVIVGGIPVGAAYADVLERLRARIRDTTGHTFAVDVLTEALSWGVRRLWPQLYRVEYTNLGLCVAGAASVSFDAVADGELYTVAYRADGRLVSVPGRAQGTVYHFHRSLFKAHELVAVHMVRLDSDGHSPDFGTLDPEVVDIVEDFAISWVLDGYLVGRISYDKYTVTSSHDVISPYEVEAAARRFRSEAEAALARHSSAPPAVTVM